MSTIINLNPTSSGSGSGGLNYILQNTNAVLEANKAYIGTVSKLVYTLPSTPNVGDTVTVASEYFPINIRKALGFTDAGTVIDNSGTITPTQNTQGVYIDSYSTATLVYSAYKFWVVTVKTGGVYNWSPASVNNPPSSYSSLYTPSLRNPAYTINNPIANIASGASGGVTFNGNPDGGPSYSVFASFPTAVILGGITLTVGANAPTSVSVYAGKTIATPNLLGTYAISGSGVIVINNTYQFRDYLLVFTNGTNTLTVGQLTVGVNSFVNGQVSVNSTVDTTQLSNNVSNILKGTGGITVTKSGSNINIDGSAIVGTGGTSTSQTTTGYDVLSSKLSLPLAFYWDDSTGILADYVSNTPFTASGSGGTRVLTSNTSGLKFTGGAGGHFTIPDSTLLDISGNSTWFAAVRTGTIPSSNSIGWQGILAKVDDAGAGGVFLSIIDRSFVVRFTNTTGGTTETYSAATVASNTDYFVVTWRNGANCYLSVNGVITTGTGFTGTANIQAVPLRIGAVLSVNRGFDGIIKMAGILNGAISNADLAYLNGIDYSRFPHNVLSAVPIFTATTNGNVPATGGTTTQFLRADGTWADVVTSGGSTALQQLGYTNISSNLSVPLVFYWDDSTGVLGDYVSKQNFGIVGTAPTRILVDNTSGIQCLGGSSGHFTIPDSTSLNVTGNFTYFAAVRTGTIPSSNSFALQGIIGKSLDTGGDGAFLGISNNKFLGRFVNSSGVLTDIYSDPIVSNTDYFVMMWRNGANCYLRVNGVVTTTSTFTGTNNVLTTPLRIGNLNSVNYGFQGVIKAVGMTNGALSNGDVTYLSGIDWTKFPHNTTSAASVFTTAVNGLVPASGSNTSAFLRGDGTWATITTSNFNSSTAGIVPASGGGTTNFLRADGSWTTPTIPTGGSSGSGVSNTLIDEDLVLYWQPSASDLSRELTGRTQFYYPNGTADVSLDSTSDGIHSHCMSVSNSATNHIPYSINQGSLVFLTDLTIEFGVYRTAWNFGNIRLLGNPDADNWHIHVNGNALYPYFDSYTPSGTLIDGVWNHVAICWSGIICYTYINGVLTNIRTATRPINLGNTVTIGNASIASNGSANSCKISYLKITNGRAKYTSNTYDYLAELEADYASVKMGAGSIYVTGYSEIKSHISTPLAFYWDDSLSVFGDYVSKRNFDLVGSAPTRALVDNTSGMQMLGGSNGHYTMPASTALDIGGNVTYFAAIKTGPIPCGNSSALQGILTKQTDSANGVSLCISSSSAFAEFTNSSGTTFSIGSSVTLLSNTDYFIIAWRNGANCYISVNGTVDSISTFTGTAIIQSTPLRIGNKVSSTFGFQGIIKAVGVLNGAVLSNELTYLNSIDWTRFPFINVSTTALGGGTSDVFSTTVNGLVPSSGTNVDKYLKGDGTWSTPDNVGTAISDKIIIGWSGNTTWSDLGDYKGVTCAGTVQSAVRKVESNSLQFSTKAPANLRLNEKIKNLKQFSVAFWQYTTTANYGGAFGSWDSNSVATGQMLFYNQFGTSPMSYLFQVGYNGNNAAGVSAPTTPLNAWQHFVCTVDIINGSIGLYSNGVFIGSSVIPTTAVLNTGGDVFGLGGYANTAGNSVTNFLGFLEQFLIIDSVLTQTEVNSLYNGGNGIQITDNSFINISNATTLPQIGYRALASNLSIPLAFYWDDSTGVLGDYVSKTSFDVVGTAPARVLVDNTSGIKCLGGSTGHYTIPDSTLLDISGNISLFAAIKTGVIPSTNSLTFEGIISKVDDTNDWGYFLSIYNNHFYVRFTNTSNQVTDVTSTLTLTSNTDYLVKAWRVDSNCYISVNGIVTSVSTFSGTNNIQNVPLRIGNISSTTYGFQGIIKAVGICNGAFSTADLTYLDSIDFTTFPHNASVLDDTFINPMLAQGDLIVSNNSSGAPIRLPGNSSTQLKVLSQIASTDSVPWTPASLTTSLWLDPSDSSTVVTASSLITQLNDKSGNNRNAVQSNTALQPNLASTIGGLNALTFTGEQWLEVAANFSFQSYAIVFRDTATVNNYQGYVCLRSTNSVIVPNSVSNINIRLANGTTTQTTYDGGVDTSYFNGVLADSILQDSGVTANFGYFECGISSGLGMKHLVIGADTYNSSPETRRLIGSIGEILLFDSALSLADRQRVEGYLAWKWSLQDKLPTGHPYKLAGPLVLAGTILTSWRPSKELLVSDRTYYISNSGSDSNTGLSAGYPIATLDKAISILTKLDLNSYNITLQLADGTYDLGSTGLTLKNYVGGGKVTIQGNTSNANNVVLTSTNVNGTIQAYSLYVEYTLSHLTIKNTNNGHGINVQYNGRVNAEYCIFRDFGSGYAIVAANSSLFTNNGTPITFMGSMNGGILAFVGGRTELILNTVTMSSAAFGNAFVVLTSLSTINTYGVIIAGSATGRRYDVTQNSIFASAGADLTNAGSTAGTTASGGLFI